MGIEYMSIEKMNYINELDKLAEFANNKATKGEKYSYKRKLSSICKKYNKSFEDAFNDWQKVRMGLDYKIQ